MQLKILASIVILLIPVFFIGCKEDSSSMDVNFTVVKSGYTDVNKSVEKKFQLAYNQEKFDEIYKTLDSNATLQVDFKNNRVVVLTLGDKPSKEYSVKVTKIEEEDKYRTVFIETTIADESCLKDEEHVIPFEIITYPTPPYKEVLFQESIKVLTCNKVDLDETFDTVSFREVDLLTTYGEIGYEVDKRFEIVQDSKVFEDIYYNHINPVGVDKELPYVDFANETLLALFLGQYGSYGVYDIKVTSIKEYDRYIEVEIQRNMPGNNCISGDSLTSPATFVTIPKTDKEIIFKEYANVKVCK